ncbi:hypothetical protein [Streptomyces sp. NPDC002564]|uniref:hypothetical protein n=1 Tax=Streptomyces sp. NPDC002564 TaxID=3364649 RepID=UPI0036AC5904
MTDTTQLATKAPRPISEQQQAVTALAAMIQTFASLPDAHITVHTPFRSTPARLDLQLSTPQEFEAWREALQISPDMVSLHATVSYAWLAADTRFSGVKVHVAGFGVALTPEDAVAERTIVAPAVTA